MSANVSHGRGGAANIRPDDTVYTDGEIVREGPVGDQGDGKYSAGRGGSGNIGGEPVSREGLPHDDDYIPETATRLAPEQSFHVGRGGAGNEHHVHKLKDDQHGFNKTEHDGSLLDKAKHLFHGKKDEK